MNNQLELSAIKRDWIDRAIVVLQESHVPQFCADDLHRLLEPPPHDNWFGCLTAKLRCQGRIREIGRVKSKRIERNGAKITLWEMV